MIRDVKRSHLYLVLQTDSKSFRHCSFIKGDVRGVVGSEKHVGNILVFIWRKAVSSQCM